MLYDAQSVMERFQAAVERLAARLEEDYYLLASVTQRSASIRNWRQNLSVRGFPRPCAAI